MPVEQRDAGRWMSEDCTGRKATRGSVRRDYTSGRSLPRGWKWVERHVWTERMLEALVKGVKGGVWFSLIDKVQRPSTLATAWSAVKRRKGSTASAEDMIIFACPTDSFEFMDFSALWKPIGLCSSPRRGKTTDRRAGCGKSAGPVRREGRQRAVPTPIETKTLPL